MKIRRSAFAGCVSATFFAVALAIVPSVSAAQAPPPASGSASTASGQRTEPEANSAQKKQEATEGTEAFRNSPSVIKIGGMLGMKPALASSAFEWLNFLILAAAILYAIAKALPKVFRGRSEGIQKHIIEARSATESANLRLAAVEDRLSRLDGEIAAIRTESEQGAASDEAHLKQQIEEETQRILQSAEQEIAAASSQAQRSLRAYAAEIAIDRAASHLQISAEDDRALIQSFAGRLTEGSKN